MHLEAQSDGREYPDVIAMFNGEPSINEREKYSTP